MKKILMTRRNFIRLILLGILGVIGTKGFVNSRQVRRVDLTVFLKNLPPAFEGLKIGQITDIHAGPLVPRSLIREGVDLIMEAKPDLIVLTGDFVSGPTKILWTSYGGFSQKSLDGCMGELSRLRARMGVFAVLGNHDFWAGPNVVSKVIQSLENAGIQVLRNQAIALKAGGETLHLLGVDDYWENSYSLEKTFKDVPPDVCRIMLSHNPDVNQDIDLQKEHVDLILSGHTHGGQFVLPGLGALYIPSSFGQKYRIGLVKDGLRQTYVSAGLGLFFVPLRINCPADVSLIVLRKG